MATLKQEQLYEDIVKYYDFADKLLSIVENTPYNASRNQMEVVELIVEGLEKCTDQLTANFIEFIENGNSEEIKENIYNNINEIIVKIEQGRNQLYTLYKNPDLKI